MQRRRPVDGWLCVATALAVLSAPVEAGPAVTAAPGAQESEEVQVRTFSIPNTRAAAAVAARAREHVAAGRWPEALADLQALLEDYRGDLLGPERPLAGGLASQQDVHLGVAGWAHEQLRALPPQVRETYRALHGGEAAAALARARERADRHALAQISERWPITDAASGAWWTLGDLELERGHPAQARMAWRRALRPLLGERAPALSSERDWRAAFARLQELEQRGEVSAGPGLLRRFELALASLAGAGADPEGRAPVAGELRLPGPGESPRESPGPEASAWPQAFRLPDHPFQRGHFNLHAVRAGDTLLLSTSLQVIALNAWSGSERWRSAEPRGWAGLAPDQRQGFFKGIDPVGALIAPAAAGGVVVAALQVPITQIENESFNQYTIQIIIPDRRLFAFELETGRPLWNHMPPPDWDGESGEFADRTRVAGPPVIAASRVLVPACRVQGRIDYHVACYELGTGELLWSTPVIGGQRELNMFNRHEFEFSAAPLRVEGERVVALTQLGTLAALDLFSGSILWETLYEQNPLPARRRYGAQPRTQSWRNTPPVVADGVVVATPVDSDDLIGVDLESGAMLWSLRQSWISREARGRNSTDVDLLLGADETRVYLGGRRLVALEASSGIRHEAPAILGWPFDDPLLSQENSPARPVLLADRIVVPTTTQRLEIDRFHGRRLRRPAAWGAGQGGNLLAGDGALFTLNGNSLEGYFEWDLLLDRARHEHEAAPAELGPALDLAALMATRGGTESAAGLSDSARSWLDRALDVLSPFVAEDALGTSPAVVLQMHRILRSKARVLADLADTQSALRALRAARELAPDPGGRRDALIEESELLRAMDDPARLAALEQLELTAGHTRLRCEVEGGVRSRDPRSEPAADGGGAPAWRLRPLLGDESRDERAVWSVPVGLWVALERAEHYARTGDVAAELEQLHRMLELWYDESLPLGSVSTLATGRIALRVARHGERVYEPFERRAEALLERAMEAREPELLAQVSELYPRSLAARRANDVLLGWAFEEGDAATVAGIVLSELPARFSATLAGERETRLMLYLGATLADAGNGAYMRALLAALAWSNPRLVSPLERHAGRELSELSEESLRASPAAIPPPHTYDRSPPVVARFPGRHAFLGAIPRDEKRDQHARDGAPREVLLFARAEEARSRSGRALALVALGSDDPGGLLWTQHVPDPVSSSDDWSRRVAFAPGLALVSIGRGVLAFGRGGDGEGRGRRLWGWAAPEGDVTSLALEAGLALAVEDVPGGGYRVHALEVGSGARIWSADLAGAEVWPHPVCGSGKVVFLPLVARSTAVALDAFSGRRALEIELPFMPHKSTYAASWIEDGRLMVPWFGQLRRPDHNQILAIDLENGGIDWAVRFDQVAGGGRDLDAILQHDGRTYLVLRPPALVSDGGPRGIVVALNTSVGGHAPVGDVALADDDDLVGVRSSTRVVLDSPFVFLRSFTPDEREMRIQAVHLPYGHRRWVQRLPVSAEDLYNSILPLPACSATTVALAYSERSSRSRSPQRTNVYFFDRNGGTPFGSQLCDAQLGSGDDLTMIPLGDALILSGRDQLQVMR